MTLALEILNLYVTRGNNRILNNLSVSIETGTITGLPGPSGSGKSTIMRSIVGVGRIDSGTIDVLGLPAGSPLARQKIGYLTQTPSIYFDLTVEQNLKYFSTILGAPPQRVAQAIAEVSLERYNKSLVRNLSGGQVSRVSLAIALLARPEILILDEPTVGLDPVLRDDLWSLFETLRQNGTTLLISSHVMDEAKRCQRILLIREGEILSDASPETLENQTGNHGLDSAFLTLIRQGEKHGYKPYPSNS